MLAATLHLLDLLAPGSAPMRYANQHLYLQSGVDLFFALSGFVISRALEPFWRGGAADAPLELTAFWVRRMWRLWPALALWSGVCLVGAVLLPGHWPPQTPNRMIAAAFYLTNWRELGDGSGLGFFWSLAVEWQFYLLLPLLLLVVRNDAVRAAGLVALIAAGLLWRPFGAHWWMFRIDALLAGVLVFMAYRRLGVRLSLPKPHPVLAAAVTLGLLVALAGSISMIQWRFAWQVLTACLAGLLVALGAQDRGWVSNFGVGPVVDWLGSRSYSLYLCHIPIILWVWSLSEQALDRPLRHAGEIPMLALLSVLLIGLAGELSYRLVESPAHRTAQRIGRRILAGTRASAEAASPQPSQA